MMDLIITLAANIGELSTIKQKNVMNQKSKIDELFPDGVSVDVNHERVSFSFKNIDIATLSDEKFNNDVSELFKIILNSLLIEKFVFLEIFLTDILNKEISYESKLNRLKQIDSHFLGVGNEYRYNDDTFEIRFRYEPNYTVINHGNVYKTHVLGLKHGTYSLVSLNETLFNAMRKLKTLDDRLLENYIQENE
ncbi:hypothetical protein J9174_04675 [Macrococcoides canis]|uniref:hypothetical protein n=1 Tax=Macrococcoides canis TaxID=1855823 RepID=UPI001AEC2794|nr:hypothetical protein [Macrococcus canis]QTQ08970.1 hypothetical protein J9174_04675 [Macrococcus canis]